MRSLSPLVYRVGPTRVNPLGFLGSNRLTEDNLVSRLGDALDLWLKPSNPDNLIAGGSRQYYSADKTSMSKASFAAANASTGDWTLVGNVKRSSTGQQVIWSKYQDANNYALLEFNGSNVLHYIAKAGGSTIVEVTGTTACTSTTAWIHFSVVLDRDSAANTEIYLNGSVDTSGTPTISATDISNTGVVYLSQLGDGTLYLNGLQSQIGIIKGLAISAALITWLYNYGNGRLAGEVAAHATLGPYLDGTSGDWWNLNETSSTADGVSYSGANDLTPTFGELLINHSFSSDLSNWTNDATYPWDTAVWSAGSASLIQDGDGTPSYGVLKQTTSALTGHRYRNTGTVTKNSGTNIRLFLTNAELGGSISADTTVTSSGAFDSGIFTAVNSIIYQIISQNNTADDWLIHDVSLKAVDIPAANGPSTDVASDSSSNANHGTYNGAATSWRTSTPDGSPNPTVLNTVDATTYPSLMVGFADPSTARSAHGIVVAGTVPGKKITFDGVNDYIQCTDANPSQITFCCWIRTTHSSSIVRIASKENSDYETSWTLFMKTTGLIQAFTSSNNPSNASADANSLTAVNDGQWHHVALTISATQIAVWVDGVQEDTGGWTRESFQLSDVKTLIGATSYGGTISGFFPGDIADPRIYSSALTAPQIAAIAAGDNGATGTPVVAYDFNESDTRDLPALGSGLSLAFDGVDDKVSLGATIAAMTSGTFSTWLKLNVAGGGGNVVLCGGATATTRYIMFYSAASIYAGGASGQYGFTVDITTVFGTAWHHVAVSYSSGIPTLYIDGVSYGAGSSVGNTPAITHIAANADGTANFLPGKIDDFRVYNIAKSAAEVLALSQGTDDQTGIVGHWKFDDGAASPPSDGEAILELRSGEGNRVQLQQATAGLRGTYSDAAVNGKGALKVDGTDDYYSTPSVPTLSATTGRAVFCIKTPSTMTGDQVLFAVADTGSANNYVEIGLTGGKLYIESNAGGTVTRARGGTTLSANTTYRLTVETTGSAWALKVNDSAETLTITGSNSGRWFGDVSGPENMSYGATKASSVARYAPADILLLEAVFTDKTETDALLTQLNDYLDTEYGL